MKNHLGFIALLILCSLLVCTTKVSARKLFNTCREAGCAANNLTCCFKDGRDDDDFDDDDPIDDFKRKKRRAGDSGFYCASDCNRIDILATALGWSLGIGIPVVGFTAIALILWIIAKKKRVTNRDAETDNVSNSTSKEKSSGWCSQPSALPKTDHDPMGMSSAGLYPTTSTFKS